MNGGSVARFDGRIVAVTGAGSGVGRAVAQRVAAEGAQVACLDLDQAGLDSTLELIGDAAAAYQVDVTDAAALEAVATRATSELGVVDTVVTCAGIGRFDRSHEISPATWEKILSVNLSGTFFSIRAFLPGMIAAKKGTVVTIGSNAGIIAQPYSAAYCASKAGVIHVTKALADEYMKDRLRFVCVAPGSIDTPLQNQFAHAIPEGVDFREFSKIMPKWGAASPEQIANVVTFLASDEADYMTGVVVPVDAGLTM